MPLKRKKTESTATAQMIINSETTSQDFFLDKLIGTVSDLGFQQVLLPPVEERRVFLQNSRMQKRFAQLAEHDQVGAGDFILSPTYLPSLLKRYKQLGIEIGLPVAKCFYLLPVVDVSDVKLRVSHELGIFIFGDGGALAHTQLVNAIGELFPILGIPDFTIELSSLGCSVCQKEYLQILSDHYGQTASELCDDCRSGLEDDPRSVWTCRQSGCQVQAASAPQVVDFLDESCKQLLMGVLECVDELGLPYQLNPTLVGSWSAENVLFQVTHGAERNNLGQGGSFSSWVATGGRGEAPLPILGFVASPEKLWRYHSPDLRPAGRTGEVFVVSLGEFASRRAMVLYRDLRRAGIVTAEAMLGNHGLKGQLKAAVSRNCEMALIIGQKEALDETAILRDMRSGMQEVFAVDRIIEEVQKRLGR